MKLNHSSLLFYNNHCFLSVMKDGESMYNGMIGRKAVENHLSPYLICLGRYLSYVIRKLILKTLSMQKLSHTLLRITLLLGNILVEAWFGCIGIWHSVDPLGQPDGKRLTLSQWFPDENWHCSWPVSIALFSFEHVQYDNAQPLTNM